MQFVCHATDYIFFANITSPGLEGNAFSLMWNPGGQVSSPQDSPKPISVAFHASLKSDVAPCCKKFEKYWLKSYCLPWAKS